MFKQFGAIIFALIFSIYKIFPIKKYKVFFLSTHSNYLSENLKYIHEEIVNNKPQYRIYIFCRADYSFEKLTVKKTICKLFKVLFVETYHLATSSFVILDNIFITGAHLKFKEKVKVVQVWHAVGTFKKFGEHYKPSKGLDILQKKANKIYTNVVVNSYQDIQIYSSAFNIDNSKVLALGSASCDFFFDEVKKENVIQKLHVKFPELLGKKIILYAPTFRDDIEGNNRLVTNVESLAKRLSDEYHIFTKFHPHIIDLNKAQLDFSNITDVTFYESVNELMLISDILVTDYSSLIFEFVLLEKPIIFLAFDLSEYEKRRGFYHEYTNFVPGLIVKDVYDISKLINSHEYLNRSREFKLKWHDYLDGKSAKRFVDYFL